MAGGRTTIKHILYTLGAFVVIVFIIATTPNIIVQQKVEAATELEVYHTSTVGLETEGTATYNSHTTLTVDRTGKSGTKNFLVFATIGITVDNIAAKPAARLLQDSSTTLGEAAEGVYISTTNNAAGSTFSFIKRVSLGTSSYTFDIQGANTTATNNIEMRDSSIIVLEESANAQYAENTTVTCTGANTGFVDALTLTFTPSVQDDYVLMWAAERKLEDDSNTNAVGVKFLNQTDSVTFTDPGSGRASAQAQNDNVYYTEGGVATTTIEALSHTLAIEMDGAGTADETCVNRAAIVAIPYSDFASVQGDSQVSRTFHLNTLSDTNINMVGTTVTSGGDYLIFTSIQIANEVPSVPVAGNLVVNVSGSSVSYGIPNTYGRDEDNNDWQIPVAFFATTTTSTNLDAKMQAISPNGATNKRATVLGGKLLIIEVPPATAGNSPPSISSVTLYNQAGVAGGNITLVEDDGANNGFVIATTTIGITDTDTGGCTSISSVSATLYRDATSTAGTTCRGSPNDNNCYVEFTACTATTTGDTCGGSSDTTVEYDCGFKIWYLADPTATNEAGFGSSIWAVSATTSDSSYATTTATNSTQTVEVLGLLAHRVTATIPYGSLNPGSNTGAVNQTTTITVSGNSPLDTDTSCDVMCTDYGGARTCPNGGINGSKQQHTLLAFPYNIGNCTATTSPTTLETILAKPTATTTAVTDNIFWGIGIDSGQASGSYTGENILDASAD